MKINAKYYNAINTTPKEVHKTKFGKIEIYSLNQYPTLYAQNTSKGRFHVWCNNGGKDYKLLIEDKYHETVSDLYEQEINELWLGFYEELDNSKKNIMRKVFLPISLVILAGMTGVAFLPESLGLIKTILSWGLLIGVFATSIKLNKRINNGLAESKNKAIGKIQEIVTEERFNELIDLQESFIKQFYKDQYVAKYGEESYAIDNQSNENNKIEDVNETK